jgi:adenosine kinase
MLAIIGSIAQDYVAVTPDTIFNKIAPKPDQINDSPVFYAPSMYIKEGGTGANIAYAYNVAAQSIGHQHSAVLFGACSSARHRKMSALGHMAVDYSKVFLSDKLDAQCHIITDPTNAQITAFHPGAMEDSLRSHEKMFGDFRLALVSPSSKDAMLDAIDRLHASGTKVFFDPGQALSLFTADDLEDLFMSGKVYALICNHHEILSILETLNLKDSLELTPHIPLVIVTKGPDGIDFLWTADQHERIVHVPAAPIEASEIVDPTGCGDAFRGGFMLVARNWMHTLQEDWLNLRTTDEERFVKCLTACAEIGAAVARLCLKHDGPQGYFEKDVAGIRDELVQICVRHPIEVSGSVILEANAQ